MNINKNKLKPITVMSHIKPIEFIPGRSEAKLNDSDSENNDY